MSASHTIKLSIDKMSCASCVGRVDKILSAVSGVERVAVNLATEEATVDIASAHLAPEFLAQEVTRAGYPAQVINERDYEDSQAKHSDRAHVLARRTLLAAVLALPVVVLEMGGHIVPTFHQFIAQTIGVQFSWAVQAVLTTAILFGPGRSFYALGISALLKRAPDMNSLVAIGTAAAYLFSLCVLLFPDVVPAQSQAVYFEAAAVIVVFILLGRWLEARAKGHTGAAIRSLLDLQPKTANLETAEGVISVDIETLSVGDIVLLKPGERVAVDAVVTEGRGHIDESMITGEPLPVEKVPGDLVTGGTVNGQGSLKLKVRQTGADTVLASIIRMVQEAQGAKLPIQTLVDRITHWFVPGVLVIATLTAFLWGILGPEPVASHALVAGVAVLIIACPCAMGLATPTSIMVATGRAAEMGVLFRKGDALQSLAEVDLIAFDKTGTLTVGQPELSELTVSEGYDRTKVLRLIASLEARAEHPVAKAIVDAATQQGLELAPSRYVTALSGMGIEGVVSGQFVLIGSDRLMKDRGLETTAFQNQADALSERGHTVFFAAIDDEVAAMISVSDQIKPDAERLISGLVSQGIEVAMITGDRKATAETVCRQIGIDKVVAEVLPNQKVDALTQLRGADAKIAFVGDGINDAPALAYADVGIAIGTGTDIAIEAADVVLMSGNLQGITSAVSAAKMTMRNIRQNLFWAFGYNVALIPVAAGALYSGFGILLSPQLAAGAMALSSLFVLANALRLRRMNRRIA
ncbi:heavy metal translocating P-type ATPase [uncultured Roseobacter sp.]|uniref:heavy metal translocating P-type ATPase n=1 Tax=uncultured Roseobacter sp. TaxID=114847 RepID=UPI0026120F75|nr:heavy metal translocating P-type ATPase [uncultured Roseobacter sp.]